MNHVDDVCRRRREGGINICVLLLLLLVHTLRQVMWSATMITQYSAHRIHALVSQQVVDRTLYTGRALGLTGCLSVCRRTYVSYSAEWMNFFFASSQPLFPPSSSSTTYTPANYEPRQPMKRRVSFRSGFREIAARYEWNWMCYN